MKWKKVIKWVDRLKHDKPTPLLIKILMQSEIDELRTELRNLRIRYSKNIKH